MNETGITGYDIIGDVHGHCDILEALLSEMGYVHDGVCFSHPDRKAIFVGDLIDRGPKIRETLEQVKAMSDNDQALVTAGNHEYNAVCFCTQNEQGEWLREHSKKNLRQFQATQDAFTDFPAEWASYLDWFKELPLFLDMEGFRVVHACWSQRHIDILKEKKLNNEEFLQKSAIHGTREFHAIETVLKGPEIQLPEGICVTDKEGNVRKKIRVKWWNHLEGGTFNSLAFPTVSELPSIPVLESSVHEPWDVYPDSSPPVFVGHYWLPPQSPAPYQNVACLDYSVAKNGFIGAYRWDSGATTITSESFVISHSITQS